MCENRDVCPTWRDPEGGFEAKAESCSSDALLPNSFELLHGKRLSCECSGQEGDWSTSWACNQQPYTHWVAEITQGNATGAHAHAGWQSQAFGLRVKQQPQSCWVAGAIVQGCEGCARDQHRWS